jgi:hypothetical protein
MQIRIMHWYDLIQKIYFLRKFLLYPILMIWQLFQQTSGGITILPLSKLWDQSICSKDIAQSSGLDHWAYNF